MKTKSSQKQITIALVVAIFVGMLASSANAALLARKLILIIPPPIPAPLKVVSH